jgi:hypothetical protein
VSQEEANIKEQLYSLEDGKVVRVPIEDVEWEVGSYTDDKIAKVQKLQFLDPSVKVKTHHSLMIGLKGMCKCKGHGRGLGNVMDKSSIRYR